ncbi:MAG: PH domain-containing protein [Oscillospiraceae bacterium]|nr:PH domain-containing protein [Oscillospiraceae bacterium]
MAFTADKLLWTDRKRYFGLPLSFTRYAISEDRLFQATGILNLKYEEILLYRIRDITLSRSFGQRIFGVGSITVTSSDKSRPVLVIQNVKDAPAVKELIHQQVEDMKIRRRVRFGEIASFGDDMDDQLDGEV